MKGSITFVGLSAAAAPSIQPMEAGLAAAAQAGLPEKLQRVLLQQGVFLPPGVTREAACCPHFFILAHHHRVSAGVWVRNSILSKVLTELMPQ